MNNALSKAKIPPRRLTSREKNPVLQKAYDKAWRADIEQIRRFSFAKAEVAQR